MDEPSEPINFISTEDVKKLLGDLERRYSLDARERVIRETESMAEFQEEACKIRMKYEKDTRKIFRNFLQEVNKCTWEENAASIIQMIKNFKAIMEIGESAINKLYESNFK